MIVQQEYKTGMRQKFDIPGFITSAVFLPVFLYGLSEVTSSTNTKGWSSPLVLGCMWVAVVSFVLFLYTELTVKHPMINLKIFKDHNFSLANLDRVYIRDRDVPREYFSDSLVIMQDSLGLFGLPDGFVLPARGISTSGGIPVGRKCFPVGKPKGRDRVGIVLVMYQFLHELFFLLSDR